MCFLFTILIDQFEVLTAERYLRLVGRMEEWLLFVNKIIIRPDGVLMIRQNDRATPPTLQYQVLMSVRGQPSAPAPATTQNTDGIFGHFGSNPNISEDFATQCSEEI